MDKKIPDLDEIVLQSLDFFAENPPQALDLSQFQLPIVIGSGNSYNTGTIIFSEKAAIFADESNFKDRIESYKQAVSQGLKGHAVVISASGGKDSVWEIELAKRYGFHTTLLTTKDQSDAAKKADKVYTSKSIDEPYTYNTSTYMGMILSAHPEDIQKMKKNIESLQLPANFNDYKSYSFIVPDRYVNICPMLDIKKDELFGPHLAMRAFSQGHARHAKFVNRTSDELVITIGSKNEYFGDPSNKWDIYPPNDYSFAGVMALTYFIVGKIQKSKPQWFKENIANYVSDYGPKAYGKNEPFDLIVPGSK